MRSWSQGIGLIKARSNVLTTRTPIDRPARCCMILSIDDMMSSRAVADAASSRFSSWLYSSLINYDWRTRCESWWCCTCKRRLCVPPGRLICSSYISDSHGDIIQEEYYGCVCVGWRRARGSIPHRSMDVWLYRLEYIKKTGRHNN